ncbi:SHOCT domain-containing protein [Streptomyces sp. NPDC006512]|uniref:SHOCT domain-containing protein n=1 Tax=Streptomyces sp. NPDC006512 TaxID=3154307 RepID=UPI00339FE992
MMTSEAERAAAQQRHDVFVRAIGSAAGCEGLLDAGRESATSDRCGPHLKNLSVVLLGRERVLALGAGSLNKEDGAVVLTSQRLMLIRQGWSGMTALAVALDEVRTSYIKQGILRNWLVVESDEGAEEFLVRDWEDLARIELALRQVRGALADPDPVTVNVAVSTAAPVDTQDVLGQIARLGELHKEGVLTDAEFAWKKQQLLDRL